MNANRYQVLFNPASAGWKTYHKMEIIFNKLLAVFGSEFDFHRTEFKDHARQLSRTLCLKGYKNFIVIGGDGTIQECVNGLFLFGKLMNPNCCLGIISSGTGQGFAKSIGLPDGIDSQIKIIKNGKLKCTDLGLIKFGFNGYSKEIVFINEFQAGIGSAVVQGVNGKKKKLGGTIAYGIEALSQALSLPNQPIKISIGSETFETNILGVVVANGSFTGGSMNLVPDADPCDHYLDLLIMHAQGKLRRLRSFSKIYSGRHLDSPFFESRQIDSVSLYSDTKTLTEADGEVLDFLPCTIRTLPSALKIFSA